MAGKPDERDRKTALGRALRAMFRRLEDRPVPERLKSVVDQLETPEPAPRKRSGGGQA
jgi:hypothetical protein